MHEKKPGMKQVCKDCRHYENGKCELGIGCFPTCRVSWERVEQLRKK